MKDSCPPEPAIRTILMPKDTNSSGTIFGGIILANIDLAGDVEARKVNPLRSYVTVAMDEVVFHEPVFVGDLVSFYTRRVRIGRTSVTVHVEVLAQRRRDPKEVVRVTEAEVVYVAVDENRRPIPLREPDASNA